LYASVPEQPQAGDNAVAVQLTATDGTAISDATVTATYFMAAMPAMSMPEMRDSFELAPQGDGRYSGNVRLSMGGTWSVTVVAKRGEEPVARKVFNIVAKE
jgi:Cu(I)/Ag(I) efflux system membrane fusion protein/cobalt-zinc-cadmium efflux system membrane fusion protein